MERAKGSRAVGERFARAVRCAAVAVLVLAAVGVGVASAEEASRVDLNTASAAELTALPGIGPAKAQAIIEYRETAPFKSADELVQVKGIGQKLYEQIKDKVTVGSAASGAAGSAAGAKGGRAVAASGAR